MHKKYPYVSSTVLVSVERFPYPHGPCVFSKSDEGLESDHPINS